MAAPVRRRTRARELALQMLYALELRGGEALDELDAFIDHHTRRNTDTKGQDEVAGYARKLVRGVIEHRSDLNGWIEHIAENWRLDRMAHVDRNVLRMAVYELLYETDVPFKVVINEAIDIAKRFSTTQSGSFVNGILDRARILIEQGRAAGAGVPQPPKAVPRPGPTAPTALIPEPRPRPRPRRPGLPPPPRPAE